VGRSFRVVGLPIYTTRHRPKETYTVLTVLRNPLAVEPYDKSDEKFFLCDNVTVRMDDGTEIIIQHLKDSGEVCVLVPAGENVQECIYSRLIHAEQSLPGPEHNAAI
jgi:hypothetical protein